MRPAAFLLLLPMSWACSVEPEAEPVAPSGSPPIQTEAPAPATDPDPDPDPDPTTAPTGEAEIGRRAIDFTLEAASGGTVRLSDHEGEVIVLDLSGFT